MEGHRFWWGRFSKTFLGCLPHNGKPCIWMFCSEKSTEKINAVHERSFRIFLNVCEFSHSFLLEEAHLITFHQRCINSLMIEVCKYLNGHSPDIMNDIFKLRENMHNLRNFHIFQTENLRSFKYGLDAIQYRVSQLLQQVPIDTGEAACLALFKNHIKSWKCEDCPWNVAKYLFKMSGISD